MLCLLDFTQMFTVWIKLVYFPQRNDDKITSVILIK